MTGKNVADIGKSLRRFRERLAEIDERIEALTSERENIRVAPVTRDEAIAALDEQLAACQRDSRMRFKEQAGRLAIGNSPDLKSLVRGYSRDGVSVPRTETLLGLLADPIRSAVVEEIRTSERFRDDALPREDRDRKIGELDEQIDTLERERAALLGQLREAGFSVSEGFDEVAPGDEGPAPIEVLPLERRRLGEAERTAGREPIPADSGLVAHGPDIDGDLDERQEY